MQERPVLYLIDGHALAYRSFFALQRAGFVTSAGESTSAVYGFSATLLNIFEKFQPKYLAVTFDKGLSGREAFYPGYKSSRPPMPPDLKAQFERIFELVAAFNIPQLTMPDMEADDILGTISRQAVEQGLDVHIATGDRDILQLLGPHVRVQLPQRRGDDIVYDEAAFRARYGIEPSQLIELKALMGDSSDDIPGVAGIGEKSATKLLQQYRGLEEIYAQLPEHSTRVRNCLIKGEEMAFLSRRLATIMRDLDIQLDLDACVLGDFELKAVDEVFAKLEFRSHRERVHKLHGAIHGEEASSIVKAEDVIETIIVRDQATLADLVNALNSAELIAFDTETTGLDQMAAELVGIALAVDGERGYYIPVNHQANGPGQSNMFSQPVGDQLPLDQLPLDEVLAALRPPLQNPSIPKVAHNAVYDLIILQRYGIDVAPIAFDTLLAEWLSNPISKFLKLKALVAHALDVQMTEIDELLGKGKDQKTMSQIDIEVAAPYAAADAGMTWRLVQPLRDQLADEGVFRLYHQLELPLIPIISQMQRKGVALDVDFLQEMGDQQRNSLAELQGQIFALGGGKFNINSPKQLNEVLFGRLGLPTDGLQRTKLGFSTDTNTLQKLRREHEIIGLIESYRELAKLKSTYVDALPTLVNPRTGRLHTSYNQTGAATGRFSSSNPNLQNIPNRTEMGRQVRRAFVAPAGYGFLAVDYNQIELRVMAHISEDETLIAAFQSGLDIHRATAAAVFGIGLDDVSDEQRDFAKRVNFGLCYGQGAYGLASQTGLTRAEAQSFIDAYFAEMPGVKRYIDETRARVWEHGYTETLYGRRRSYPQIKAGRRTRGAGNEERAAINMPIQGTAADILKQSMIDLDSRLRDAGCDATMILQVHDELVLEVREDELAAVGPLVVETMETAFPDGQSLRVPLKAKASWGANWRDMHAFSTGYAQ